MKKLLLTSAILALSLSATANASTLDFSDSSNLGVTLGGGMKWNGTGGGHLYNEYHGNDDFIYFNAPTTVNSFDLNAMPWEGYTTSTNNQLEISFLDSSSNVLNTGVYDLTAYTDWSNWLTVVVNLSNVSVMRFTASGPSAWPSVDNIVINENISNVPVPAAVWLMGSGLLGLMGFSRKNKKLAA